MSKPRYTAAERKIIKAERDHAEKFMAEHLKVSRLQYVNDGKHDVIINIKWGNLVKLLAGHTICRIAEIGGGGGAR